MCICETGLHDFVYLARHASGAEIRSCKCPFNLAGYVAEPDDLHFQISDSSGIFRELIEDASHGT